MLHIQLLPQRMCKFTHESQLIANLQLYLMLILDHHSELSVPIPQQAPIIDVCRPYQSYPIINDHQLAVDVDDLGHWLAIDHSMRPQAEK